MSKRKDKAKSKRKGEPSARYEAAYPSRKRDAKRTVGRGEVSMFERLSLREQARWMEENSDLANSILDTLVNFSVGPTGVGIEYQPIDRRTGRIDHDLAEQMAALRKDWNRKPEVTGQHTWAQAERLAVRSMFRDGEIFAHHLVGTIPSLDHLTKVPYSLEFIECDFIPPSVGPDDSYGIQTNAWGRPTYYRAHKIDRYGGISHELKSPIPASEMIHMRNVKRFHRYRGVSIFGHVMSTMQDIKEANDAELIARKVAASMAAYKYTEGGEEDPEEEYSKAERFEAGMIYNLKPGTKIGVIDTRRSSNELTAFVSDRERSLASGLSIAHSTMTRKYDGNFSSRRQELVESFIQYGALAQNVIGQLSDPVNRRFIDASIASRQLIVPSYIDLDTIYNCTYTLVQMPWIDPLKEATAYEIQERNSWTSGQSIIRGMGKNPADVFAQEQDWREMLKEMPPHPSMTKPEAGANANFDIDTESD